jgi:integrase/recombinase XerD
MKAYLELDETDRLGSSATCLRDRLLIRLLARLGCRVSEVLALTVDDVDFNEGTVTIQHLKSRLKLACPDCKASLGKSHTFCPRCGARVKEAVAREQEHRRTRTLPLDTESLEMLRDYVSRGGPVIKGGKELIFGIGRGQAWRVVRDCAKRAGLGQMVNPETGRRHGVSPHRLRDAFAVNAMKHDDSGDGLRLLQEHLGHCSFNTTARYRKVSGQEHREWYESLWPGSPTDSPPEEK